MRINGSASLAWGLLTVAVVLTWGVEGRAQWGDVKGRVILDGAVKELPPLVKQGNAAAKDAAVCAVMNVPDESVVVDPESKGIANVAVYLRKAPDKINPELKPDDKVSIVYDQKFCRFLPHITVVQTGQSVEVLNSDGIAHNTRGNPLRNTGFNFIVAPNTAAGSGIKIPLKQAENVPMKIGCDIHPWMTGWWVVVDHPYAAVTDKEGNFSIKGLPPGEHEFRVWQENVGYVERSLKVVVKAGSETVVPDIKVPAATLYK